MKRTPLVMAIAIGALALGLAQGSAGGASPFTPKKGTYSGNTKQEHVLKSARKLGFTVKGKKITLTTEPVVAKGFCASPPVFLLDTDSVSTKLKGTRFSFSATFIGTKTNRIKGAFVDAETIEGEVTYHFADSDAGLCTAGKVTTSFKAKRK